ncbi:MAG: hypothetical protein U1E97_07635 [Alphaproteobacteria bacterium]
MADGPSAPAHPHVKRIAYEIELRADGSIEPVTVVYTDLALNRADPAYDGEKFFSLVSAVQRLLAEPGFVGSLRIARLV